MNKVSTRAKLSASLTVVALVLGLMVTVQYRQTSGARAADQLLNVTDNRTKALQQRLNVLNQQGQAEQKELAGVNSQLTSYEKQAADKNSKLKSMEASLSSARILAGTTAVTGPGIEFTVNDGTPPPNTSAQAYLTHDWLVRQLVNELFAGGAEAVSVNNYRIVATSGIFCKGPVIEVNGQRITAPFDFKAIGYPHNLSYTLTMPGGEFDILRNYDHLKISPIQSKQQLNIPAYTGTVSAPPTTGN